MRVDTVSRAGIGWRHPHYAQLLQERPALGFIEVHSENFFADGGAALAALDQAREHHAVSLHGVGLGLGSAAGIDAWHLERLARLAERVQPVRVSDHAAFARAPRASGAPVLHANDLLPLAFTPASLDIMVENLSAYLAFADDRIPEPEFFAALCRRSGCGMLLDVNNLMVNALNAGAADPIADCRAFIDRLPPGIVGEIHLAGYCETEDIVIDDHGSRVRAPVWQVYRHALERLGPVPTLIEWDTDVPALAVLLAEAQEASRLLRACVPEAERA